jgi:hypothetical protein
MARTLLKTGAETRAERVKGYNYAAYHNTSVFFTLSFLLDPDFSWTFDWSANAAVSDNGLVLAHIMQRNLGGIATRINLHPPGWQGENEMVVSLASRGGLSPTFGTAEHRLAVDTDWTTFISPATAESTNAQRYVQLIGPHTQLGEALTLTIGEWWEIILQIDCRTDVATGGYTAWVRKHETGPAWTSVLDTPRNYKTVGWRTTVQPPTTSGIDNQHRVGGVAVNLPGNRSYFWDQFTVSTSFAAASASFHEEPVFVFHNDRLTGTLASGAKKAPVSRITGTLIR